MKWCEDRIYDPGWSEEKQEKWESFAPSEDIDPDRIDEGMGPLLYDLNTTTRKTGSSNVACDGSFLAHQPSILFRNEIPLLQRDVVESINKENLPRGWEAERMGKWVIVRDHTFDQEQRSQLLDEMHNECIHHGRGTDEFSECADRFFSGVDPEEFGLPTREEREQVDTAFYRGFRDVIGT